MDARTTRYMDTLKLEITDKLFTDRGERLFDMNGGQAEADRIAKLMRDTKALHPRGRKYAEAIEIWASLVEQNAEQLDWAVLQGGVYAGYHIVP